MSRSYYRTRIKFCGMTRAGDVRLAGELGVDAVGFIFARESSRRVAPAEARAMRQAIASAEVADEQRGADPTTNLLQERVAELLGQEAALFLPSGTMCNQISFRLHARPGGDELILERMRARGDGEQYRQQHHLSHQPGTSLRWAASAMRTPNPAPRVTSAVPP